MSNIGKKVKILKYGGKSCWDQIGVIKLEYSTFFTVELSNGAMINPNTPDSKDPQCIWVTEHQQLPIFN